ncbi:hypothetical protein CUN61_07155 [Pseudomonas arsenicoxydans]|uniref:Uncharacterized protein n=1 Tax=Pseudomonas arsenicoxydans TaxID=702115 RepID=A0A4P6FY29_9PSED|nr:hypothetical protein CUN61_07155 [Pseudomonas arsenicoxydans]
MRVLFELIVPTLCVGMPHRTLCVRFWDAERPRLHSHAERGNERCSTSLGRGSPGESLSAPKR